MAENPMTDDRAAEELDLQAILERANAAEEGPWIEKNRYIETALGPLRLTARDWQNDLPEPAENHLNRIFIAHARTDVPLLTARIRALEARAVAAEARFTERELTVLRSLVEQWTTVHPGQVEPGSPIDTLPAKLSAAAAKVAAMRQEQCQAVVYRRDTYRYTGRVKGGFEMHYTRSQCKRRATIDGLCGQHAKLSREMVVTRWDKP